MSMSKEVNDLDTLPNHAGISLAYLSVLEDYQARLTLKNLFESFPTGRTGITDSFHWPLSISSLFPMRWDRHLIPQLVQLRG